VTDVNLGEPGSTLAITHPEWGIFLGHCLGLAFWSKLEPVGQPAAATFPSVEVAEQFMASWSGGRPPGATLVPVIPDMGTYASVAACVAAGLDGWIDDLTPSANQLLV